MVIAELNTNSQEFLLHNMDVLAGSAGVGSKVHISNVEFKNIGLADQAGFTQWKIMK